MGKLLFWTVLIVVAWLALRLLTDKARGDRSKGAPPRPDGNGPDDKQPETMRQCAYCGTYVPVSEAIVGADGRDYCGRPHLDAAGNASTK